MIVQIPKFLEDLRPGKAVAQNSRPLRAKSGFLQQLSHESVAEQARTILAGASSGAFWAFRERDVLYSGRNPSEIAR